MSIYEVKLYVIPPHDSPPIAKKRTVEAETDAMAATLATNQLIVEEKKYRTSNIYVTVITKKDKE